ncbi:MAG: trypsin-like serine protease [Pseudorhodoplanes sp.]
MLRIAAILLALSSATAFAMTGGSPPASGPARAAVMITGPQGFCTGTVIAHALILTAAHCVAAGTNYKLIEFGENRQPVLRDIARIATHPQFNMQSFRTHRATADVALVKLASPLAVAPAPLMDNASPVAPGDAFIVAGYGLTAPADPRSGGTLRSLSLVATGRPGNLQIRLVDPATNGARIGLGACTGDSGGPVFRDQGGRLAIVGVISWATGPNNSAGCGGLTGVTPLSLYRGWIVETARRMGSPL